LERRTLIPLTPDETDLLLGADPQRILITRAVLIGGSALALDLFPAGDHLMKVVVSIVQSLGYIIDVL